MVESLSLHEKYSHEPLIFEFQIFSNSPPPTIPVELQFLILDLPTVGHGAATELHRLSFICVAWALHIQSLLFRQVTFGSRDSILTSFLRESPHLAQHITVATFVASDAVACNMPAIHDVLSNVRTVQIHRPILQPPPASHAEWRNVTRLCFTFCALSSAQDLWDLLRIFPHCERLEFAGWWRRPDPASAERNNSVHAGATHLKHLAFQGSLNQSPQPVAAWLAMDNLAVDRLSITLSQDESDLSAYNLLLSHVGHALQDLELAVLPVDGMGTPGELCFAHPDSH
jgi:hypothetical protein